jgi:transcriptional regulator with XRE-family HTH domain
MTLIQELLSQTNNGKKELLRQDLIVNVTEQLWAAMESSGISKADLARAIETSKSNVTQLLSGQRNMTLSTLADLAAALGRKPQVVLADQNTSVTKCQGSFITEGLVASSGMFDTTIVVAHGGGAFVSTTLAGTPGREAFCNIGTTKYGNPKLIFEQAAA